MKKTALVVVAIWTFCGWLNFGAIMAHFSANFGYEANGTHRIFHEKSNAYMTWREHLGISFGSAVFGPFAFPGVLLFSNIYQHGFVWTVDGVAKVMECPCE